MSIKCNHCPIMCGLTGVGTAHTEIPKDSLTPVPGITPEKEELVDIRQYCEKNYVEFTTS